MIINEPGKYRLLKDYQLSGLGTATLKKAGELIEINSVDPVYEKVMGPSFHDWEPWNLPVERIE